MPCIDYTNKRLQIPVTQKTYTVANPAYCSGASKLALITVQVCMTPKKLQNRLQIHVKKRIRNPSACSSHTAIDADLPPAATNST